MRETWQAECEQCGEVYTAAIGDSMTFCGDCLADLAELRREDEQRGAERCWCGCGSTQSHQEESE